MANNPSCDHCGDEIIGKQQYTYNDKSFCCNGCMTVYQLLTDNQLGAFYNFEDKSGVRPQHIQKHKYDFLEVPEIKAKFVDFEDDNYIKITLFLPEIHCSSCIYLLENLPKILPAITSCQVAFVQREALITFRKKELKLSELAYFLNKIGYAPNFGNRNEQSKKIDKIFLYKLGIAAFAFGSIMLWSFPEYLGIDTMDFKIRSFTSALSLVVSIPVLLFSARDYFVSAYKSIKSKSLNLDVPIVIGIMALYTQSVYTILTEGGPGYMDSFAGFVFFLLIGKWFQNRTYKSLSFDRDYTSYFPVAVTKIEQQEEQIIEIEKINIGDTILIRNEEIIPCDSILQSETAKIDYSFVTGESEPIYKNKGDYIYAGGKLLGQKVVLKADKSSNRSLLTQLWNDIKIDKFKPNRYKFQDVIAKYFLWTVLSIATISAVAWWFIDSSRILEIVVAVLIVACPCALALSSPFTFGNSMKLMGRKGLYLKNTTVIERMNEITDIVFDKTGTLTESTHLKVHFDGDELDAKEKEIIYALANSSTHPLSRAIVRYFKLQGITSAIAIDDFEEVVNKGTKGNYDDIAVLLGSYEFIFGTQISSIETETYVKIGSKNGKFVFESELRHGVHKLIKSLDNYTVHVLSGDKDKDFELIKNLVGSDQTIRFNQNPNDKLDYVLALQNEGKKVLMIGDGLNDSGALGVAHVSFAVSEDVFRFTPSSDGIIKAEKLHYLADFLDQSHYAKKVLTICLAFSLIYNTIGLSFAIGGLLSPLVAAIIMPSSSITVVGLSTLLVYLRKSKR
ncbi:MAG: heavy metal translocating P-type ATPase metal-binding domain-containing protein [Crocinitomicaceae bacterium]|nr:heavy metal translocating P-type ATPase metal-binding domain-containing protein [Crocinitomicaceae bacterium]